MGKYYRVILEIHERNTEKVEAFHKALTDSRMMTVPATINNKEPTNATEPTPPISNTDSVPEPSTNSILLHKIRK